MTSRADDAAVDRLGVLWMLKAGSWSRIFGSVVLLAMILTVHDAMVLASVVPFFGGSDCGCSVDCRCRSEERVCACGSTAVSLNSAGCSCGGRTHGQDLGSQSWETILIAGPRILISWEMRLFRYTFVPLRSWLIPFELLHPA